MGSVVHENNRCLAASANTAADLECNHTVWCGLTWFNAQNLFGLLDDLVDAANVAGGAETELDGVLSARCGGKE